MEQRDEQAMLMGHLHWLIQTMYKPSRELSLVLTKMDEAELWLTKCERKDDA